MSTGGILHSYTHLYKLHSPPGIFTVYWLGESSRSNAFVATVNKVTRLLALFVLGRVLIVLFLFCVPCLPLLYRALSLHQRALAAARGIILSTADHFFTLAHCFCQGITSCVLIPHFIL